MKLIEMQAAHDKAFSVASAMPERFLREASSRFGLLLDTGASFREAETALQPLSEHFQEGPKELA